MKTRFTILAIALWLCGTAIQAATYQPLTIVLTAGASRELPYTGDYFYCLNATNSTGTDRSFLVTPKNSGFDPIERQGRQGFVMFEGSTFNGLVLKNPNADTITIIAEVSTQLRSIDNRFAVLGAPLPVTISGTVPTTANVTNLVNVLIAQALSVTISNITAAIKVAVTNTPAVTANVTNAVATTNVILAATNNQVTKTVSAAATPEALAADGTFFRVAIVKAIKSGRTANTGTVYLGGLSTNDSQPIDLAAGAEYVLRAAEGTKLDLNDFYLDVATDGDGATVIYW
jgi:hypothetical protein